MAGGEEVLCGKCGRPFRLPYGPGRPPTRCEACRRPSRSRQARPPVDPPASAEPSPADEQPVEVAAVEAAGGDPLIDVDEQATVLEKTVAFDPLVDETLLDLLAIKPVRGTRAELAYQTTRLARTEGRDALYRGCLHVAATALLWARKLRSADG